MTRSQFQPLHWAACACLMFVAISASAQQLAPNQTHAFGADKFLTFTYLQSFDCVDQPLLDLDFNGIKAESDPNEQQFPICQVVTEPTQDPTGGPIAKTAHLYVLVPMFSVDNDQYQKSKLREGRPSAPLYAQQNTIPAIPDKKEVAEKPVTNQQRIDIVNKIVERYRKRHNSNDPSIGYVNEKLKGQGQHFRVAAEKSTGLSKGLELKDVTISGFNTAVVEHSHKILMDGETSISNNGIGVLSDNPDLQVEMHDKAKIDQNRIGIDDDSQQTKTK